MRKNILVGLLVSGLVLSSCGITYGVKKVKAKKAAADKDDFEDVEEDDFEDVEEDDFEDVEEDDFED